MQSFFTEQKAVTSHRGPLHPNHLEKKEQFELEKKKYKRHIKRQVIESDVLKEMISYEKTALC